VEFSATEFDAWLNDKLIGVIDVSAGKAPFVSVPSTSEQQRPRQKG
jgi:hypothetical protein